ncbi:hypothetical protein LWI29_022082 [Acer saccharum]|uniref:Uncharacterized protein n=1 Tax=Acer saccharum TaxID=4024 RepID=A0AA39W7I2_ACESA|nr:hypothetical protein LWI29_022082 [Acer saccharum]
MSSDISLEETKVPFLKHLDSSIVRSKDDHDHEEEDGEPLLVIWAISNLLLSPLSIMSSLVSILVSCWGWQVH